MAAAGATDNGAVADATGLDPVALAAAVGAAFAPDNGLSPAAGAAAAAADGAGGTALDPGFLANILSTYIIYYPR